MGDWGLKVSLPGKSISSTTPEDYVFNSKNPANVMIVIRGGSSVVVNGSASADVSVTHSLGYIPVVMLFTELTPGSGLWHMGAPLSNAGDVYVQTDSTYTYCDSTYFKVRYTNNTGSQKTVSFYYYIFSDSAN